MSLAAYKVLHLLGAFLVLAALGAALAGGSRKGSGMLHGAGLLLVLVAGFGALARLGLSNPAGWPLWLWLKLAIWLALGAGPIIVRRSPLRFRLALWIVFPLLAAAAGYLSIYKPS